MFTSPSGKRYIGQTINSFNLRKSKHVSEAMRPPGNKTCSPCFHAAIRKYGIDNFKEEVLLEINNELLDQHEQRFIALYNTLHPNGYNMKEGGRSNHKVSEESRKRMSESKKKLIQANPEAFHQLLVNNHEKSKRTTFLPMYVMEEKNKDGKHIGYRVSWHPKSPEPKIFIDESNLESAYAMAMECYQNLEHVSTKVSKKRQESTKNLPRYIVEIKHRKTKVLIGYGVNCHQFGGKRKDFTICDMTTNLENANIYLEKQLELKAQRLNGSG
jgi:hypothetical protein